MEKRSIKVLVVDDDDAIRQSMANALIDDGFEVIVAKDGLSGLQLAKAEHPQLALLDLAMPKMGGMEMMKELRHTDDWGKKLPIIIFTNLEVDDKIMQGITEDEPSYIMSKSEWSPAGVLDKVKETLGLSSK